MKSQRLSLSLLILSILWGPQSGVASEPFHLNAVWHEAGRIQPIKTLGLTELSQLKKVVTHEKDPRTGRLARWEGFLLSAVVNRLLDNLHPENRAQIDLVILKGVKGGYAVVPRALITKYPILLAQAGRDTSSQASDAGFFAVIPWSSKPKILKEDLPVETYFVPHVQQIELTSYKDQYSPFFLKRRTDPSAMRGEKLFVQNCVTCHTDRQKPISAQFTTLSNEQVIQKFLSGAMHGEGKTLPKLSEKDWQSILRYLNAYRGENAGSIAVRGPYRPSLSTSQ